MNFPTCDAAVKSVLANPAFQCTFVCIDGINRLDMPDITGAGGKKCKQWWWGQDRALWENGYAIRENKIFKIYAWLIQGDIWNHGWSH
jgi:hypothetical protein